MAIRRVNSAIVDEYRFVCGEDYFRIESVSTGQELVHMKVDDFQDIVEWFVVEGNPCRGDVKVVPVLADPVAPKIKPAQRNDEVCTYDPGNRTAVTTVPLPIAETSPESVSVGGLNAARGESVGVVDLASVARAGALIDVAHQRKP